MANSKKMTPAEKRNVSYEGGFEYFVNGSDFPEVKAADFREAHRNLVSAWRGMEELLGPQPEESEI